MLIVLYSPPAFRSPTFFFPVSFHTFSPRPNYPAPRTALFALRCLSCPSKTLQRAMGKLPIRIRLFCCQKSPNALLRLVSTPRSFTARARVCYSRHPIFSTQTQLPQLTSFSNQNNIHILPHRLFPRSGVLILT